MDNTGDEKQQRRKRKEFTLMLLLGGIFLILGIAVAVIFGHLYSDRAAQIEQRQLLSAQNLRNSPTGREVLLEGRIAQRNETRFRTFVAYLAAEFRGWDSGKNRRARPIWAEVERVTPPLRLELPDGFVQIANSDYTFQSDTIGDEEGPITWQDKEKLVWDRQARAGTRRYTGYEVGSPVLALGLVTEGPEGPALEAKWIYGGSRASYIANQRQTARFLSWFGPLFALIGVGIMGLGVWQYRRSGQAKPGRKGRTKRPAGRKRRRQGI